MAKRSALICGVSGQDGAYLARFLLKKGYRVVGTSRDATTNSFANLHRLGIAGQVETVSMAQTDFRSILQALEVARPDEIYNLAGQSSVGLSFQQPMDTFNGITVGVINLLEAVRFLRLDARVYNASSSECFGDAGPVPCNEDTAFRPVSPYATAKAAAHWLVANYRDAYGVHACSGILFNHESPLRPARFVTSKIVRAAVEIARAGGGELRLGNLDISRDWGWAPDYVDAMWRMLQTDTPSDYVIATGEAWSLRAFCARAFEAVGLNMDDHVVSDPALMRPSDIAFGCGDPARAARDLGWRPTLTMPAIVDAMIEAERAVSRD